MNKTSTTVFVIILLFAVNGLCQDAFQTDTVLRGRVLGEDRFQTLLVKCKVSVIGTDGMEHNFTTNDCGEFFLTNAQIKPGNSYLFTFNEDFENGNAWFMNYTAIIKEPEFVNDSLPLIRDTYVHLHHGLIDLSHVFFRKNSSIVQTEGSIIIDYIVEKLSDNPRLMIEIAGHAYIDEHNPDSLALERAHAVEDQLISEGIAPYRTRVVANGIKSPRIVDWFPEFNRGDTLSVGYIEAIEDSGKASYAKDLNRYVDFSLVGLIWIPEE